MTSPSEKLASSLEILKELQDQNSIAIRSSDLSRTHRERLLKNGFLLEIIKGWYIPTRQDGIAGESTAWYASFWDFCAAYLKERFGSQWVLSPEQSLSIHAGNWTVPRQVIVRSPKANNSVIELPHKTSFLDVQSKMPDLKGIIEIKGLRIFSLESALIASSPRFFMQNPTDARTALSLIKDVSELLGLLLNGNHTVIAGRLAGGFRNISQDDMAEEILRTMAKADYKVKELNPFDNIPTIKFSSRERSPYVNRMQIAWQDMREVIIKHFPKPKVITNINKYLSQVEETYITDAYHSLSIEGYRVTPELIQRVRTGGWDPDNDTHDKENASALAARGYWQAFKAVKESVGKVLKKTNPGKVFEKDHRDWYRELFAPSIAAGILKPSDLAGYRRSQVYIRHSMHVPPNIDALRDLMPAFSQLLSKESNAAVRIVLGHFFFVYIHPYMDGNGRLGRFLMNVMLASGGYPWVVVPVESRNKYFNALEEASVRQNILPFCKFISELVTNKIAGKNLPKI